MFLNKINIYGFRSVSLTTEICLRIFNFRHMLKKVLKTKVVLNYTG